MILCSFVGYSIANDKPKLLLIHLDGVSYQILIEEMRAGNLPQIEYHFIKTGRLEKAITYYPSKTPFVVSSIRDAKPSSRSELVGWKIPEFYEGQSISVVESFLMMALSKHRPARSNLIYGLPFTSWMAHPAFMNTIDLFDEYPVIEFYWYTVDTYGHFFGEDEYRKKLREFDSRIGKYLSKLSSDVNVIIYSDHGMIFGEGIKLDQILKENYADVVKAFSYPSVYLYDVKDIDKVAKSLINDTDIDFSFYLLNNTTAKGYTEHGTVFFTYRDNKVRFTYEGEDPFGYYANGYNGEYFSPDEWLLFSSDMDYPATPVKVFTYLLNPNSGDITISFNDEKYAKTFYSSVGNHGGLTATEVLVPVMVRGPAVEYLGDFEVLWLQELFNEIRDFKFNLNPARDRHYLSSHYDFRSESTNLTASLSPVYRTNFGTDVSLNDFSDPSLETIWGRYDLYRSYLARLWFGAGVDFRKEDTVGMLFLKHELRIRGLRARTEINTSGLHRFTLGYRVFPGLTAELTNFTGPGLRISL